MSLYKIPLIVFLTRDFVITLTPPHPPPSKGEVGKTIGFDIPHWRNLRVAWVHTGQIALASVEALSIVFHHLPASTQNIISHRITVPRGVLPQLHTTNLQLLGAIIWLAGTRLRFATFARLGPLFRFEISIQRSHKLITTGPYAYVRHPSYTGVVLISIGWFCYQFAPGSWLRESVTLESWLGVLLVMIYLAGGLVSMLIIILGRLEKEDEMLHAAFGKEWEEWAQKVPFRLIPGVY